MGTLAATDIVLDDLTLGYDRHPAVHHVSGTIRAGALLAVVGPNGAGKSTLLKGLIGEIKPLGGHIRGLAAQGRHAPHLAYVPQKDGIDLSYPVSVFDLVAMGLWLIDNCQLEDLAGTCARLARWEFQFVLAPIRFQGVTGSPVNPLAVF